MTKARSKARGHFFSGHFCLSSDTIIPPNNGARPQHCTHNQKHVIVHQAELAGPLTSWRVRRCTSIISYSKN
jgi:hypothetical protein